MKRLSELPDDELLMTRDGHIETAREVRDGIWNGIDTEFYAPLHTVERLVWRPNAREMLEQYIDSQFYPLGERGQEKLERAMTQQMVGAIQYILDQAFGEIIYHEPLEPVEIEIESGGADGMMRTATTDTGMALVSRRYLDALRDVVVEAKAIRNGWSQAGWEDFCEALDTLDVVERLENVVADKRRIEALERLYELVKRRRSAERAFDEAGEAGDAEAQVVALPYVDYFDREIEKTLTAIDATRKVEC